MKKISYYAICRLIYFIEPFDLPALQNALSVTYRPQALAHLTLQVFRVLQSLDSLLLITCLEEVLEEECFSKLVPL